MISFLAVVWLTEFPALNEPEDTPARELGPFSNPVASFAGGV